jgi:hypothetical protein
MSEIRNAVHETPAVRVVEIEVADAGGGLHVFRSVGRIHDLSADGERVVASETVRQGVVDDDNLERLMSNLPFEPYTPYDVPKKETRLVPMVAAPETFEIARREGNPITNAEVYRRLTADGLLNATDKSNLVRLVADGFDYESILFYSVSDYAITDVRGRPLPMAMRFDYMDGGFDNEKFDLDRVAEALSRNEEVEFLADRWQSRNDPVSEIPHYNAYEGRDRQVQFIWRPTDESWNLMLEKLGFDPADPKHLRIKPEMVARDIDFFGLEQFRLEPRGDEFDGLGAPAGATK